MSDSAVPARERRTHRRRPLTAQVWLARGGSKVPVSVVNVSVGGAAVETRVSASAGDIVALEVLPARGPAFALAAKVVRSEPGFLGLRFLAFEQRALEALLAASNAPGDGATEDPSGVHHLGPEEAPGSRRGA